MREIPIENIDENVLIQLIENKASESRYMEFKRDLPGSQDKDIKEFLNDISSFANTSGGDIVYGIDEVDGAAGELTGVTVGDLDSEILKIDQRIRAGIEPKLFGVRTHGVSLGNGRCVIVIRVPQGQQPPHRVTYKNSGRFFARHSRGKYEMDVHELRNAFVEQDRLPFQFRQLHAEGIARARGEDMPFGIRPGPTAVISVIPQAYFRNELKSLPVNQDNAIVPFEPRSHSATAMIEGVLIHEPYDVEVGGVRKFAMTYRDGRSDAAWSIGDIQEFGLRSGKLVAYQDELERGMIAAARATRVRLLPFGVDGPWVVIASVYGMLGSAISLGYPHFSKSAYRDEALIGELRIDQNAKDALLPIAENFWLLFGVQRPENMPFGEN